MPAHTLPTATPSHNFRESMKLIKQRRADPEDKFIIKGLKQPDRPQHVPDLIVKLPHGHLDPYLVFHNLGATEVISATVKVSTGNKSNRYKFYYVRFHDKWGSEWNWTIWDQKTMVVSISRSYGFPTLPAGVLEANKKSHLELSKLHSKPNATAHLDSYDYNADPDPDLGLDTDTNSDTDPDADTDLEDEYDDI